MTRVCRARASLPRPQFFALSAPPTHSDRNDGSRAPDFRQCLARSSHGRRLRAPGPTESVFNQNKIFKKKMF